MIYIVYRLQHQYYDVKQYNISLRHYIRYNSTRVIQNCNVGNYLDEPPSTSCSKSDHPSTEFTVTS